MSEIDLPKKNIYLRLLVVIILISCLFFILLILPKPFPFDQKIVVVEKGESIKSVANKLQEEGIIYSSLLFSLLARISTDHIIDGPYYFQKSHGVFSIIERMSKGDYGVKQTKVTIPEGFTVKQISERLNNLMPIFNEKIFLEKASSLEGYLFPDTYYFNPNQTEEDVIKILTKTFEEKNEKIFDLSEEERIEVIKLASIVEREVMGKEDKKIVAEIFVKRMDIGMALQADSTLTYERGGNSFTLSITDLRSDSPYNSYTRKGLPPTPISNPGKDSLDASYDALIETKGTTYLYFLTDKDGNVHYARTHDEHVENKNEYLR